MFNLEILTGLPPGIEAKPPINGYKEYIVTTTPENIDHVERDLETDTSNNSNVDSNIIPDRPVEVANRRHSSNIQTHYWLTDAEAANLINDPRILILELHPDFMPGVRPETSTREFVS